MLDKPAVIDHHPRPMNAKPYYPRTLFYLMLAFTSVYRFEFTKCRATVRGESPIYPTVSCH